MKRYNKIIVAVICTALTGLGLQSCEDFLDVNTSKDQPITTTVDQALPVACFYGAFINYDHAEYNVYLSQCLTTNSKSQTGSYPYSQGWEFLSVNRHPMWRRHFYDLGTNINKMRSLAQEKGMHNADLIGRTIMFQSTLFTTDCFGEMPHLTSYASVGEDAATSPAYNSQEEIYDWLFKEADELVALYDNEEYMNVSTNIPITKRMDRIYKGDMQKWGLYAKALRCRLWLRKLPNWDNTPANCEKIIGWVNEILASGWEEPRYYFDGGTNEQNCPWGPYRMKINSWESRDNRLNTSMPSAFMANIMGFYSDLQTKRGYALDPRAVKMMKPRPDGSGKTVLRYLENNIGMDNSMQVNYYPDLYPETNPYTQNNGYICLFTTEELLFIKAEAQYWAGDKTGAYQTVCEAVRLNGERYQVDWNPASNLLGDQDQVAGFWKVRLPGPEITLDALMQQKYVAMYLQPEQWTDMRRYNYSSSRNGIQYDGVYVYNVQNTYKKSGSTKVFNEDCWHGADYSLRRPYNLYEPYWCTADNYSDAAEYSPNAWINRLNPDTETETKYNRAELQRIGAMVGDQVDFHWLKKRMIWAKQGGGNITCEDKTEWM